MSNEELKLSDIQEGIIEDLDVKEDDLFSELLLNAKIHGKYINLLARHRIVQKLLEHKLTTLKREKWFYYSGRADDEVFDHVLDKTDTKFVLESDKDILKIKSTISVVEVKIKVLEEACKAFVGRGFNLKSAVEMKKINLGLI